MRVAVAAVLAGAENFTEIAQFAKTREVELRALFDLKGSVPSHDTFRRVLSLMSVRDLEAALSALVSSQVDLDQFRHIAIDGKTICASGDQRRKPAHVVSAYLPEAGITILQERVASKSFELEALYRIVERLPRMPKRIITIDALGCQVELVRAIVNAGHDYVLSLKRNQIKTFRKVEKAFSIYPWRPRRSDDVFDDWDESHGRLVRRTTRAIRKFKFVERKKWPKLQTILSVNSIRTMRSTGAMANEDRYFISSLGREKTAEEFAKLIRGHWGIENKLHWVLDVAYGEDRSRLRCEKAAENFSSLRKLSLNLIRTHPDESVRAMSIASIRKRAAWDPEFLRLLFGIKRPSLKTEQKPRPPIVLHVADPFRELSMRRASLGYIQ